MICEDPIHTRGIHNFNSTLGTPVTTFSKKRFEIRTGEKELLIINKKPLEFSSVVVQLCGKGVMGLRGLDFIGILQSYSVSEHFQSDRKSCGVFDRDVQLRCDVDVQRERRYSINQVARPLLAALYMRE